MHVFEKHSQVLILVQSTSGIQGDQSRLALPGHAGPPGCRSLQCSPVSTPAQRSAAGPRIGAHTPWGRCPGRAQLAAHRGRQTFPALLPALHSIAPVAKSEMIQSGAVAKGSELGMVQAEINYF